MGRTACTEPQFLFNGALCLLTSRLMAAFSFILDAFHMIRPSQLIALIIFDEEYKSRIPLWSYLQLSLTSSLLGQSIFFNTLFQNTSS